MDKDFKKLITFYIGTLDKDTHRREKEISVFKKELDKTFDGYTLSACHGIYRHKDGTMVNELSLRVEYIDYSNTLDTKKTCDKFKKLFNQECIMVTIQELQVDFI